MCNNTLGILIIWGEGEFDYLGDFEYFWGDFFWGGCPFEIKYIFFIMN